MRSLLIAVREISLAFSAAPVSYSLLHSAASVRQVKRSLQSDAASTRPQADQYLPPWRSPRRPGAGRTARSRAGGPEAISIKALGERTRRLAAGAVPAFRRPRGAAAGGDRGSVPAIQRDPARGDRQAVETLETVALCAGRARFRPEAERHLPPDVRLAHHGLRGKGQRAPRRRARNASCCWWNRSRRRRSGCCASGTRCRSGPRCTAW